METSALLELYQIEGSNTAPRYFLILKRPNFSLGEVLLSNVALVSNRA